MPPSTQRSYICVMMPKQIASQLNTDLWSLFTHIHTLTHTHTHTCTHTHTSAQSYIHIISRYFLLLCLSLPLSLYSLSSGLLERAENREKLVEKRRRQNQRTINKTSRNLSFDLTFDVRIQSIRSSCPPLSLASLGFSSCSLTICPCLKSVLSNCVVLSNPSPPYCWNLLQIYLSPIIVVRSLFRSTK